MPRGSRLRVPALVVALIVLLAVLSLPAFAAGPKRIFITKSDEKFNGQAGVTFELYEDTDGDGVRDDGEPLLQTKVTDAAGKATFDPVKPGKYIVHEVTPAGYKDQPDQAVEIPNAKGPGPQVVYQNEPKPANHRVNDPTGDTSVGDGTHVFDFDPAIAPAGGDVLVAWNHSAGFGTPGGVSGVTTALSHDLGVTWGDYAKAPPGSGSTVVLGEPTVVTDPVMHRFILAAETVTNTGSGFQLPIMTWTAHGQVGFWNDPVNTFPEIPPDPALAHGADLTLDPRNGNVYLGFTLSNGDGTSEAMVTRSTDGADSWGEPISVSGSGTFDHVDVEVARNGNVYVSWTNFGGSASQTYDILISKSTDNGTTFGPTFAIRQASPKSGTQGECTGSVTGRTVLGAAAVFNRSDIAVDPRNANTIFATYPIHGQADDESDVYLIRSNDAGRTWSGARRVGSASGTQFAPRIAVTVDGRVAVAYYDNRSGSNEIDPTVHHYDPYANAFVDGPESLTDGNAYPLWELDPSFDTHYGNCFGLGDPDVVGPGSGFFIAWTDGRDPGPAGNDGIDPNIYFANDIGPFLDTSTSLRVSRTASKIKASGEVSPPPLQGAIVRVRLFRDDGGGFEQVASKRAKVLDADGDYSATFGRPNGGTCKITVVFEGSEGREPSPSKSKTFAC